MSDCEKCDDEREAKHFREVIMTFEKYKTVMLRQLGMFLFYNFFFENLNLDAAEASYKKIQEKFNLKRDFDLARSLVLHNQLRDKSFKILVFYHFYKNSFFRLRNKFFRKISLNLDFFC